MYLDRFASAVKRSQGLENCVEEPTGGLHDPKIVLDITDP